MSETMVPRLHVGDAVESFVDWVTVAGASFFTAVKDGLLAVFDVLDAALSAPPDDDPHWEQWTAEALDEMLDDVAHKASSLAQTVLWHHHAANHGIETPENTRRQCLDTLDDLRDLMNRDASRHPLT